MIEDSKNFEKYVEMCGGSRYAATAFVSKKARKLAQQYHNVINHSEALSWVVSGKLPNIILNYKDILKQRENKYLILASKILSNVQDAEVKKSVLKSIKQSKHKGHLIYYYEDVYDEYRQSRVRILTRKIWFEMQEQGELDW